MVDFCRPSTLPGNSTFGSGNNNNNTNNTSSWVENKTIYGKWEWLKTE
jgi:hypothetical protein